MYGNITLQYSSEEQGAGDSLVVETRIGRIHLSTTMESTSVVIIGWDGSTVLERHYENRDFPSDTGGKLTVTPHGTVAEKQQD